MITKIATEDPLAVAVSGAAIGAPVWLDFLPFIGQGIMFTLGVVFLALKIYNATLDSKIKNRELNE